MRGARFAAWGILAAGLIAGAGGRTVTPAPLHYGNDVVLAADLHVHSAPGDGALAAWDLSREAARRGIDAIAITNHNNVIAWKLARLLPSAEGGALIIPGDELTAIGYHMAAVGITGAVDWRQSAASAARAIRAAGGVAIAAHPAGAERGGFDDAAIRELDGYEAAHPLMFAFEDGAADLRAFERTARAIKPTIAAIGSTDFHFFAPLGFCRTFVFARERSAGAVIAAIRDGRTVACDGAGETYGPAELTAVVASACRASAGSPARDSSPMRRYATVLVWVALCALVVFGSDEPA